MQKDFELKDNRVADERVKMSRIMQALKKAEQGLWYRASKLKAKEEKLQHTFQMDPDISVDEILISKWFNYRIHNNEARKQVPVTT